MRQRQYVKLICKSRRKRAREEESKEEGMAGVLESEEAMTCEDEGTEEQEGEGKRQEQTG